MTVTGSAAPIETQTWPQLDKRDPLGIWGVRGAIVGDASGGKIEFTISVAADKRSAFVYNFLDINLTQVGGLTSGDAVRIRILTNWPNIDPQAGVQAYSTAVFGLIEGDNDFGDPIQVPRANGSATPFLATNQRFLLCYDPRSDQALGTLDICQMTVGNNGGVTDTYVFEAYGLYWDRSVMQAPGGPRFPG